MTDHQAGPTPQKIASSQYPLDQREAQNQQETRQEKAYVVKSEKMPTIEFEQRQSGTVGTSPATSGKPLREPIQEQQGDPERNLHDQFVKEGSIQ